MSSRPSILLATVCGAALILSTMWPAEAAAAGVRSPAASTSMRDHSRIRNPLIARAALNPEVSAPEPIGTAGARKAESSNDARNDAPCGQCRVSGTTRIFTDRAAFLGALVARPASNAFDEIAPGASGRLTYSSASLTYLVYTQTAARGALYNGAGFVSTDRTTDKIVVQILSDAPVTAIGGDFRPVDFLSHFTDGTIHLALDDGTQETISSDSPSNFRGFVTASPIHRLVIDAPDILEPPVGTTPDRWPAMDNVLFGVGQ